MRNRGATNTRLLLFSLLSFMLSLSPKPARAQIPGSGGLGSGGSGLPGPGYPSGPSWHITISSTGNVTANPPTGTQTAAWNTPAETVVSSQTITQGQTVTITTTGQYTIVLQWLNGDGSSPRLPGMAHHPRTCCWTPSAPRSGTVPTYRAVAARAMGWALLYKKVPWVRCNGKLTMGNYIRCRMALQARSSTSFK